MYDTKLDKLFLNFSSLASRYKTMFNCLFKENPTLLDELLKKRIIITNKLGEGCSRCVFNCFYIKDLNKVTELPLYVIKFSLDNNESNQEEISLWLRANEDGTLKDLLPWLCPITAFNKEGNYLIMKKAKSIPGRTFDRLDLDVHPSLDDVTYFNFGIIGEKVVCVDYAYNHTV